MPNFEKRDIERQRERAKTQKEDKEQENRCAEAARELSADLQRYLSTKHFTDVQVSVQGSTVTITRAKKTLTVSVRDPGEYDIRHSGGSGEFIDNLKKNIGTRNIDETEMMDSVIEWLEETT
jgi:hypothetical protein